MVYPPPNIVRFFDRLAPEYERRLKGKRHSYHRHFHRQRVEAALEDLHLDGKAILDVGAGTGLLYEHLCRRFHSFEYLACDCSSEMLLRSAIPPDRRILGSVQDLPAEAGPFDCAFILGVSTYNTKEVFGNLLAETARRLRPRGLAVVSFTHRRSLDQGLRRLARPLARFLPSSAPRTLVQSFPLSTYTPSEARALAPPALQPRTLRWLNQTLSPFNLLLPGLSIRLGKQLRRRLQAHPQLLGWFSADFLLVFEKG